MILETEILFIDEMAGKLNKDPERIWGKFSIDLREIIAVGEYIEDNYLIPEISEITMRSGDTRYVKMPYAKLLLIWKKANPELKFAIN